LIEPDLVAGLEAIIPSDRLALTDDGNADAVRHYAEPLVHGPQPAILNCCGSEQMNVYIPYAATIKLARADESHDFVVFSDGHRAQLLKQFKRRFAVRKVAAGELTHDERMHYDVAATETLAKLRPAPAKVVNPD
jgi:hypothetical protein